MYSISCMIKVKERKKRIREMRTKEQSTDNVYLSIYIYLLKLN